MNKRIFCILTALLLVLPSLASPSATCTHLNPDGSPNYYLEGYIEPLPGIPGFSGNVRCNICGEIVYPGQVCYIDDMYDPMNPPTDKPDPRITDAPPQYGEPQETDPDNPVNPDKPANPGQDNPQDPPANPDNPNNPADPVIPGQTDPQEQPADPENPEQPVTPGQANQEEPESNPENPEQPVIPAKQETQESLTEPEEPVQPASPAQQDQGSDQVQPEEPLQPADTAPPEDTTDPEQPFIPPEQDTPADPEVPPEITATPPPVPGENDPSGPVVTPSPLGNRTVRGVIVKEPFSEKYPFRKVKMTPQKDIRAKAAGVLLWPTVQSPFQQMLQ